MKPPTQLKLPIRLAVILTLLVVLLLGGWLLLPRALRQASYFQVGRLELVGLRYLTREEVVIAMGLDQPRSVFESLDSLQARAQGIPGVVSARVERRLPGTLRIELLEEEPIALVMHQGRLVLVGQANQILPFDPARLGRSYPIADTAASTTRLLTEILLSDPLWYQEIEAARSETDHVVLSLGSKHLIRLRPDSDPGTLEGVLAVREYLSEQGIPWLEIEGRYRGRVFVLRDLRKDLL